MHAGLTGDVRHGLGQESQKARRAEPQPTILDWLAELLCYCGKREGPLWPSRLLQQHSNSASQSSTVGCGSVSFQLGSALRLMRGMIIHMGHILGSRLHARQYLESACCYGRPVEATSVLMPSEIRDLHPCSRAQLHSA